MPLSQHYLHLTTLNLDCAPPVINLSDPFNTTSFIMMDEALACLMMANSDPPAPICSKQDTMP